MSVGLSDVGFSMCTLIVSCMLHLVTFYLAYTAAAAFPFSVVLTHSMQWHNI